MRVVLICVVLGLAATATSARAERMESDKLAILEVRDGELAFTGPIKPAPPRLHGQRRDR
jgi:hypothetical protein